MTTTTNWTSKDRMSNSGYHRCSKPNWWARVGDSFLEIGRQRGDVYLEIPRDMFDGLRGAAGEPETVIYYGVGPKYSRDSIRGTIKLKAKEA